MIFHLVLLAVFLVSFPLQQTNDSQNPPDILIVKFSWNKYLYFSDLDRRRTAAATRGMTAPPPMGDRTSPVGAPDPRMSAQGDVSQGFQYKLKLQNNGLKTITEINWTYIFLDTNGEEVGRHRFETKKDFELAPGKTKEIASVSASQPAKVVNANSPTDDEDLRGRIEIQRVVYADGSTWERTSDK